MNDILEVNTKLALFDYLAMVREIAYEFINDEDGTYQPHIGKLNAMRLFYNYCVVKSRFDEKYSHDITDAASMEEIVADESFIRVFNDAINCDTDIKYDFGNAYRDAMEIVNVKKTSFERIINIANSMIKKVSESFSPLMTDENIKAISQIVKDMSDGKMSAEAIVDAYVNNLANKTDNSQSIVS